MPTSLTNHSKVLRWLSRHSRFVFHFTPTSCSWLNAVGTFFSRLTRRRLGCFAAGRHRSLSIGHLEKPLAGVRPWGRTGRELGN